MMGLKDSRMVLFFTLYLINNAWAFMPGFNYGTVKVRGVSLGGWLVLESWITPSIFDNTGDSRIVDEYTFGQYQDRTKALAVLQAHWDSWITETDFKDIAAAGLNHVRIPIGYWAFDVSGGEPYIQGQIPYLEKAVSWAEKYGLKVIINLHGVPGSQNGYDNSGQQTSNPSWYLSQSNVDRARAIVKQLANTYKESSVVTAIAVLNEPKGYLNADMLRVTTQYWYDTYGDIRYPYGTSQEGNTVLIISDAFMGLDQWRTFMPSTNYSGVMMDIHKYQVFSDAELNRTDEEHLSAACSEGPALANFSLWTIVGEWTPAKTDCATYRGRGEKPHYENIFGSCAGLSGNASTFNSTYKTFLGKYWEAQVHAYEQNQGWIQWTWKAEHADDWSYQAGLANGWIPQNPENRTYPDICQPQTTEQSQPQTTEQSQPQTTEQSQPDQHKQSSAPGGLPINAYAPFIFTAVGVFGIHNLLW